MKYTTPRLRHWWRKLLTVRKFIIITATIKIITATLTFGAILKKTYVPGAAVEEPNIPVAINNVPNVSLPSLRVRYSGNTSRGKANGNPGRFPIKEWNGNVVTDEVGKTWLWDGQNLNQQPENIDSSGE